MPSVAELMEALKSLGLAASDEAVKAALLDLYPAGWNGIEQGEVVRRVFLYLQSKR